MAEQELVTGGDSSYPERYGLRNSIKQTLAAMNNMELKAVDNTLKTLNLGCCEAAAVQATPLGEILGEALRRKKKMNRVNIDDISVNIEAHQPNNEQTQRDHLKYRLNETYSVKWRELQKRFGLIDDEYPETAGELIKRIQAGKYVVSKEFEDKSWRYIRWRDPSLVEDKVGFEAAEKVLQKQYEESKDEIVVKAPIDGLATLRTFETWQYTAPMATQ
jgi:hypothetical protein